MSEKIGHFEIISEIAKSAFATVYKALDTDSQQTVALKVVRLDGLADRAALLKTAFEEADRAKPLSSHNIAGLYGVGDEGDVLLAAAEYVQGNSVATTLARHEGFSIWDLQDIARQVCQGLDHAQGHKVIHYSIEPAKIMVQWDGLVKVLGFGMSSINATAACASDSVPDVLQYFSPEQLRGEALDHRSAIFSLGAILYEMATEQKAFAGDTAEQIRSAILEGTPPLPHRLKGNVNPVLSNLIMKALAKSPDERFQSGQELVRELEQCKSAGGLAAKGAATPAVKAPQPARREIPKASAAAAGVGAPVKPAAVTPAPASPPSPQTPKIVASAAPAVEEAPAFSVDPMMAEEAAPASAPSKSFSDISELPPLREVRITAPAPSTETSVEEPVLDPPPAGVFQKSEPEKPKVQVREVAQKAVREIRKTPPKLYMYAIGGAVALILLFVAGFSLHNYFQDRDSGGEAEPAVAEQAPPAKQKPPVTQAPAPVAQQPAVDSEEQEPEDTQPVASATTPRGSRRRTTKRTGPAIAPAQLTLNSSPAGAEITFDGAVLCQTPCTLTGIAPGQHSVSAAKGGFGSVSRAVSLQAGANASVELQLSQLTAILSIASNPAGAAIVIDGKDSGKLTPSQIVLDRPGKHAITIRRYGYLDASSSVNAELGQTSTLNLDLTKLGSTDEIRAAGGKFKKVFGRGDASGAGIVSVKTQPKGAQIMVNNRVLDKTAPFDFYLNPGTYVIDITMSGYRPLHRVVNLQEGEKLAIEETLAPE
jgi:eukaryotic-like serine/threonine-protein kinase